MFTYTKPIDQLISKRILEAYQGEIPNGSLDTVQLQLLVSLDILIELQKLRALTVKS